MALQVHNPRLAYTHLLKCFSFAPPVINQDRAVEAVAAIC
jgi:hypothetical protein